MNDPQIIQLQQVVMASRDTEFEEKLNELLLDGWRVVPGTFSIGCYEQAAARNTRPDFITPAGTTFYKKFFVVIERTEYRFHEQQT